MGNTWPTVRFRAGCENIILLLLSRQKAEQEQEYEHECNFDAIRTKKTKGNCSRPFQKIF
jgi:hypothetical protein